MDNTFDFKIPLEFYVQLPYKHLAETGETLALEVHFCFFLSSFVYFGFPRRPQFFPYVSAPGKLRTEFVTTFSSFAKLTISLHALESKLCFYTLFSSQWDVFILFKNILFVYLVAPGLSCSMQTVAASRRLVPDQG